MNEVYKLRQAARATVLFHGSALGWDATARREWREIVDLLLGEKHHGDATTKVLCDLQRAALATSETLPQPTQPDARQTLSNDVRARMQRIARLVDNLLPPGYGFVVFCFAFNAPPDARGHYASNGSRADVVKMLQRFIDDNALPDPSRN